MDTRQVPPTAAQAATGKLRLAVFKFSSCDGCSFNCSISKRPCSIWPIRSRSPSSSKRRSRIEPGP